jgi:hypothetical protein
MMPTYGLLQQSRTAIGAPNTWVAVTIPAGAIGANISLELSTATMRVSSVNTLAAATQGQFISAAGQYHFDGQSTTAVVVYVAASAATTAILVYNNPT